MRMLHNARLQHLAHANQCLLHSPLPHYDLFMHARPALSHPFLQHFDSMCDEIAESGAAGGERSEPPCLYSNNIVQILILILKCEYSEPSQVDCKAEVTSFYR